MTGPLDDDALLRELGAALAERPATPARVAAAGRELYTWRTVDAELAELVADSAADPVPAGALSRDVEPASRSLTFRSGGLTLDLDVERAPDALRGQLRDDGAGRPREVVVERVGAGPVTVAVDELGYFAVEDYPPAGARFRLRAGRVLTPWVD